MADTPELQRVREIASARAKQWRTLEKKITDCFVPSLSGSGTVLDPYLLGQTLNLDRETINEADQAAIESLRQWCQQECDRLSLIFDERLRTVLAAKGVSIVGRYPSYLVAGVIAVEVDAAKRECLVEVDRIRSLLAETVARTVFTCIDEEAKRATAPDVFLAKLREAYQRVVAVSGAPDTALVPIRAVFKEMVSLQQTPAFAKNPTRANFQEYSITHFSRDLGGILRGDIITTGDGHKLTVGPTSTGDGIPVRFDTLTKTIGRVGFSKENPS